ncbi:DsbA family oxidoreductase [Acetobacterium sp.]|jgi:predicted DsbA family dithiol-disulfide isomerase|uniref:DsbA family oxidoreductase n=1 Tax=Acetobacterium sp. TaxID=1872094 RepID=UPI000CC53F12|nr:DsbA family oxidoreductase [Acetobacterium sp.]MDO9491032.1 DsbA family oxidoreductase [Acetobacterium sp.]PKM75326.1 MAG: disulfide bond formation protein DsbA [Firmicutes bacterium HGW-Firmicutes-17]
MKVEVWSDYVCPFCYIGERKLALALEKTGMTEAVEIVFNSFELDPNAKKSYEENINQLIAKKYGMSMEQAITANNNIINVAKEVDLEFNFDKLQPTNTFDAHRLSHYAKDMGKQKAYTEAVMKSYFTDALNISDFDVLTAIAAEVGLDRVEALRILESSAFAEEVRQDEANAYTRQIHGVPHFLFNGKEAINGAQTVDTFVAVIEGLK